MNHWHIGIAMMVIFCVFRILFSTAWLLTSAIMHRYVSCRVLLTLLLVISKHLFNSKSKTVRSQFKGGFQSENLRQFFGIPKNIPKSCLKFVHPVHDIEKMSIVNFFDFTSLTYLQVVQNDFQNHYQKFSIVKAFSTYTNEQQ